MKIQFSRRSLPIFGAAALLSLLAGCEQGAGVKVVDLNKVLDVAMNTMDQMSASNPDPSAELKARHAALVEKHKTLDPNDSTAIAAFNEESAAYSQEVEKSKSSGADLSKNAMPLFAENYTKNLNALPILANTQVLVLPQQDGSLAGYEDQNKDGEHQSSEQMLFTLEIDAERSRMIATDTQNAYRRDSHYRSHGFFTGMLIGSMMNRQAAAGIQPSRYANMQMSPKDYHTKAQSSARAKARASSRSGSFKSGK